MIKTQGGQLSSNLQPSHKEVTFDPSWRNLNKGISQINSYFRHSFKKIQNMVAFVYCSPFQTQADSLQTKSYYVMYSKYARKLFSTEQDPCF